MKDSKYILSKVPFEPKYDVIKEQVDVNQYVDKKVAVKIKTLSIKQAMILTLSILILFVGVFLFLDNKFNIGKLSDSIGNAKIKTVYISSDIILYENDYELVNAFDYVFVGKIIEEVETKQYDGTGTNIPYTFYKYKEVEFLKGEIPEKEGLMCFYGGLESKYQKHLFNWNDEILEEGKYYLFLTNKRVENSVNKRIGENDYILGHNYQKILLEGYDEEKSINEQNKNINYTINRFLNIINKELHNEVFAIPTFNSKEELVAYYDYIAIIQISYSMSIFDLESSGDGSDIPAARYKFTRLYAYKESDSTISSYEGNIYAYGTNFWENEKSFENYTPVLEDGGYYLIFVNKKDSNDQNTRIDNEDYVLYGIDQIIKLDEIVVNENLYYQVNENYYNKDKEEVNKFIESYFLLNN